jgi:hypothetical protein
MRTLPRSRMFNRPRRSVGDQHRIPLTAATRSSLIAHPFISRWWLFRWWYLLRLDYDNSTSIALYNFVGFIQRWTLLPSRLPHTIITYFYIMTMPQTPRPVASHMQYITILSVWHESAAQYVYQALIVLHASCRPWSRFSFVFPELLLRNILSRALIRVTHIRRLTLILC